MLISKILRRFLLDLKIWFRVERVVILAVPTGIIAGLGSVVFFTALDLSHTFFLDYLAAYRTVYPGGEHPILGLGSTARPLNTVDAGHSTNHWRNSLRLADIHLCTRGRGAWHRCLNRGLPLQERNYPGPGTSYKNHIVSHYHWIRWFGRP
jgi:hypothetical protein